MHTASLSSKGQIVIPKALRSEMDLVPGTRFALSIEAGRLVLEPLRAPEFDLDALHAAVDRLAGCLYRPELAPVGSAEETLGIVQQFAAADEAPPVDPDGLDGPDRTAHRERP